MTPLRFGLIGFGAWGSHHAAAIERNPGASLVAIAAPSESSRASASERFPRATVYADYRELVEREDIDVVDVVTPSHLHRQMTVAALEAGKHVLLEKPMALTIADCRELAGAASAAGRFLAVGFELRLSSLWGRVKALIDEGYIGDPQYVLVELSRRPYRRGSDGWRFDATRVGNWILEEPIHFFDLATWYLQNSSRPQSVFAVANARDKSQPTLQDNFSATVKYEDGSFAVIAQTLGAFEHHQTVKVVGRRGALWASWSGAMDRTTRPTYSLRAFDGEQVTDIEIDRAAGEVFELEDEIGAMVQSVREGKLLLPDADDGVRSVALCLAAADSVSLARPVSLSEAIW